MRHVIAYQASPINHQPSTIDLSPSAQRPAPIAHCPTSRRPQRIDDIHPRCARGGQEAADES
ncbi:MAG TPA: hypothetical protein VMV45_16340, partial [Casimicrobiaceae bacterium]|nr:hypothetical protein [Casimicrobiaceae bacterium]